MQDTSFDHSALPGTLCDSAPDRWGQQLVRGAFRKAGEERALSEIDYLLHRGENHGIGLFAKHEQEIFHTYSCSNRSIQQMNGAFGYVDLLSLPACREALTKPDKLSLR